MLKRKMLAMGCLCVVALPGCAGSVGKNASVESREVIQLECLSTYRHGCRYMGQIVPWDQWVELKGYPTADYEIADIQTSGTMSRISLTKK